MSINDNKQEWTWTSFAVLVWLSLTGLVVGIFMLILGMAMLVGIFIHFGVTELIEIINNLRGEK